MGYSVYIPKIRIPVLTGENTGLSNIILPGTPEWDAKQAELREYIGNIHGIEVYIDPKQSIPTKFIKGKR